MKKITSAFLLITALVACGGSGSGSPESTTIGSQPIYGFAANGTPYVAKFDLQQGIYSYATLNPETGETSAVTTATLEPTADPSIKNISGHNQHTLAIDQDQNTILASTRSSVSALPEPTLFAAKPLTNVADIAGTYYFFNVPFWQSINIATDGTATLTCKSFKMIENAEPEALPYDACKDFTSSTASLKQLSPPFWELKYQIREDWGGQEHTRKEERVVIFSKTHSGLIAYLGLGATQFCNGSTCQEKQAIDGFYTMKETQNFNTAPTWSGDWIFNRQGGTSAVLKLNTDNSGSTSSGRLAKFDPPISRSNVDSSSYDASVSSFTTKTIVASSEKGTSTVPVSDMHGRSSLSNRGGDLVSEFANQGINTSALFDKVAIDQRTITFTFQPIGNAGPYSISSGDTDLSGLIDFEMFSVSVLPNGIFDESTRVLISKADYSLETFSGQVLFKSPMPSKDANGRSLALELRVYVRKNQGPGVNPFTSRLAWGVRVR